MEVKLKVVLVAVRQLLIPYAEEQEGTPYEIFWLNLPDQETFDNDGAFLKTLSTYLDRNIWQLKKKSRFLDLHSLGVIEYNVPIEDSKRARAEHILLYAIELEPAVSLKQTPLPENSFNGAFYVMLPLHSANVGIPEVDAVLGGVDRWLRVSNTYERLAINFDLAAPLGPSSV